MSVIGTLEESTAVLLLTRMSSYDFKLSSANFEVVLDFSTVSVPDKIMSADENYEF